MALVSAAKVTIYLLLSISAGGRMDFPGKSSIYQISDLCKHIWCKQNSFSYFNNTLISTGHNAQYCTYTAVENESKDIVCVVTVDKRLTNHNSVIMEKHSFIQTFDSHLEDLNFTEIVTDAHMMIAALMGEYIY